MQILYFVYKNITLGLTLFYYQLYSSFSEDLLYDSWYMVLFNVMLTSLPVISMGVFEQDVSSDVCLQVKDLFNFVPIGLRLHAACKCIKSYPNSWVMDIKPCHLCWKLVGLLDGSSKPLTHLM